MRKRRLFLSVIVLIVILLLSATVFKKENLKEASLNEETIIFDNDNKVIPVCGKINVHTIAAQKYITPQAA